MIIVILEILLWGGTAKFIKKERPWTDEYPYCDEYRRCEKLKIKMGLNNL